MPILWEEPFGIVMAEALACGTPVLGFLVARFARSSRMASPDLFVMTWMALWRQSAE